MPIRSALLQPQRNEIPIKRLEANREIFVIVFMFWWLNILGSFSAWLYNVFALAFVAEFEKLLLCPRSNKKDEDKNHI